MGTVGGGGEGGLSRRGRSGGLGSAAGAGGGGPGRRHAAAAGRARHRGRRPPPRRQRGSAIHNAAAAAAAAGGEGERKRGGRGGGTREPHGHGRAAARDTAAGWAVIPAGAGASAAGQSALADDFSHSAIFIEEKKVKNLVWEKVNFCRGNNNSSRIGGPPAQAGCGFLPCGCLLWSAVGARVPSS